MMTATYGWKAGSGSPGIHSSLNTERPFQMLAKQLWTWQRDNRACCLFVSVEKAILSSSYSSFISWFNARALLGIVNSRAKTEIKSY